MYEVFELITGHRLAHTEPGETMSTTLFETAHEAQRWVDSKGAGVAAQHEVRVALTKAESLAKWATKRKGVV